ncbi:hypothetical protein [Methylopila sp. 73B]|uniref:hypothetical protein n=1 Tax=Methylopila sp. 73B TaxID=1120792 RepID=UPI000374F873|nr:hypothetical protein [Methylopila sp. 73B]
MTRPPSFAKASDEELAEFVRERVELWAWPQEPLRMAEKNALGDAMLSSGKAGERWTAVAAALANADCSPGFRRAVADLILANAFHPRTRFVAAARDQVIMASNYREVYECLRIAYPEQTTPLIYRRAEVVTAMLTTFDPPEEVGGMSVVVAGEATPDEVTCARLKFDDDRSLRVARLFIRLNDAPFID